MLLIGALATLVAWFIGGAAYDGIRRERDRPRIVQQWKSARQLVARRLGQPEPLEFGAVWATRSGLICGLVNGWGSFGGLTGMTQFVVYRNRAMFWLDVGPLKFAPYWRLCITDPWVTILNGSMESGYCATRRGQSRCVTRVV